MTLIPRLNLAVVIQSFLLRCFTSTILNSNSVSAAELAHRGRVSAR